MTLILKQQASSILELLLSLAIGILICGYVLHNHILIIKTYYKMHHQFKIQHNKLIARHYIGTDLATSPKAPVTYLSDSSLCRQILPHLNRRQLKVATSILQLTTKQGHLVLYYLRKSIINTRQKEPIYALYRDDSTHNAVAIAENVRDLDIKIFSVTPTKQAIKITLLFALEEKLNITWYFYNNN